ncbi:Inner membrane protein ybjO [Ewingella americana]|uniref:Inner membrane protein ybjO n=1 Tax=Ewingella americana TaxID=41202 RepID=A0A377NE46_9GAMM|nr:Inner membrane protein ybjO [Ewingella americana]
MIGASAIVATRCLEFILLFDAMGVAGVVDFVQASAESWVNCFILLASLLIVWIECHASYAMMRGRNWGRWAFVGCQAVVVSYMLLASFEWFGPKIFPLRNRDSGAVFARAVNAKSPRHSSALAAVCASEQPSVFPAPQSSLSGRTVIHCAPRFSPLIQ